MAVSARNVRTFRDKITDGQEQAIRYCLNWAERILIVGFSYHPANLRKLGAPDTFAGKDVRGTVLGMADDEIARIRELTRGHIQLAPPDWSAEDIVRRCGWFGVDV